MEMAVSTALHNVQSKDRDDRESNIGNVVDFESGTSQLLNVGEEQVLASGKKFNEWVETAAKTSAYDSNLYLPNCHLPTPQPLTQSQRRAGVRP